MDKLFLIMTIILQVFRVCLTCFKWLLIPPYILIHYCLRFIKYTQRMLFVKIYLYRKNLPLKIKKRKKTVITDEEKVVKEQIASPVGSSKTIFITELPKLKSIEPVQCMPLEKEYVVEYTEDPEIDPDDVEVQDSMAEVQEMLADEDPEMFSNNEDLPSDLSSGVTIEQLTRTYGTLTQENTNAEQEHEASGILNILQGSEFFNFFMLHAECSIKAKQLMDQRKDSDIGEVSFDEHKYI